MWEQLTFSSEHFMNDWLPSLIGLIIAGIAIIITIFIYKKHEYDDSVKELKILKKEMLSMISKICNKSFKVEFSMSLDEIEIKEVKISSKNFNIITLPGCYYLQELKDAELIHKIQNTIRNEFAFFIGLNENFIQEDSLNDLKLLINFNGKNKNWIQENYVNPNKVVYEINSIIITDNKIDTQKMIDSIAKIKPNTYKQYFYHKIIT